MLKYLLGFILNLFNPAVSLFARIDNISKVNKKSKVHRGAQIFNSTIEAHSYVGVGTKIVCADVGKFCSIAGGSIIGMGIHTLDKVSTSPIFTEQTNALGHSWTEKSTIYPFKRVFIGNDVWIGARVMVMGGVSIGDGAVVGAGAIVTKDVPPYAIVAGVPAKIIHYRFEQDIIKELSNIKWWNFSENILKDNISVFNSTDISMSILETLRLKNNC